jgi:hypothetical protein
MSNLDLWNAVEKTPPSQTKAITGKSYQGTSPKPYYLVHKATETFGPIGIGWGYNIVDERIEEGAGGEKLHVARIKVWFKWNGERGEVEHVGGTVFSGTRSSGKPFTDDDAPKKSVTDALIKALSMIGFAGDIFMGRFDDSKYVQELRNEEQAAARAPRKQADISAAKVARESLHDQFIADLNDCHSLVALQRLENEWAEKLKGQNGHAWTMTERLEAKRLELSAPVDDEPTVEQASRVWPETKADYVAECHEHIAGYKDDVALLMWWNSAEEKAARKRYRLTPEEITELRTRVMERREVLTGKPTGRTDKPYAGSQAQPPKPTGIEPLPAR